MIDNDGFFTPDIQTAYQKKIVEFHKLQQYFVALFLKLTEIPESRQQDNFLELLRAGRDYFEISNSEIGKVIAKKTSAIDHRFQNSLAFNEQEMTALLAFLTRKVKKLQVLQY